MMFDSGIRDNRTYYNRNHVKRMKEKIANYDGDPHKLVREGEMLCKHCYYIMTDGIAGQAFSTSHCCNCGREMNFATTDTDDLCMQCAKELNVCKHCGQVMD